MSNMLRKSHNRDRTNQLTSIALSKENYLKLKHLGYATESINDVLNRVLADYNVKKAKEED